MKTVDSKLVFQISGFILWSEGRINVHGGDTSRRVSRYPATRIKIESIAKPPDVALRFWSAGCGQMIAFGRQFVISTEHGGDGRTRLMPLSS